MVRARSLLCAALLLVGCEGTNKSGPDLSAVTIACTKGSDCPSEVPMCDYDQDAGTGSQICVGCISSFQTCGPGLTCDQPSHTCVPADPHAPCNKNADCPRPGFDPNTAIICEVDAGTCVGCAVNTDCVSATGGVGVCLSNYTCQSDGGA